MAPTAKTPSPRETRVSTEIPCVACGHLLVGQKVDAVCPECAQPVRWSLYGSQLSAADGAWLRRRYLGASIAIVALPWVWLPLTWLAIIVAVWLLTSPNPARAHVASGTAWTIRMGTVLGYVTLAGAGIYASIALVRVTQEIALLSAAAYFLSQAMLTFAILNIVREDQRLVVALCRRAAQWGVPAILILLGSLTVYSITSTMIASGASVPQWLTKLLEGLFPVLGGICGLLCVIAIPCFWVLLSVTKRRLNQAIVRSDDIRRRVRAWNPWITGERRDPAG